MNFGLLGVPIGEKLLANPKSFRTQSGKIACDFISIDSMDLAFYCSLFLLYKYQVP